MISAKQAKMIINHAQELALIRINPQHSRKITTTSRLTHKHNSRQQQRFNHYLDEYQNVFQEPDKVPLQFHVKHSIDLVPGSSLPNTSFYKRSIIENQEIHRKIQDFINKGHIWPKSSPYGSPIVPIPKKDGTWRMCSNPSEFTWKNEGIN